MDDQLLIAFGRLEGKVDAILASEVKRDARDREVDERLSHIETEVTVIKTQRSTSKSLVIALWSAAVALIGMTLSIFDRFR